jgi:hypothetical protein
MRIRPWLCFLLIAAKKVVLRCYVVTQPEFDDFSVKDQWPEGCPHTCITAA